MTTHTLTKPAPSKPAKLTGIARTMRAKADQPGKWDRVKLAHGLDIILHHLGESQWRLALAREGVYPSEHEVAIVRGAFSVPEAAEEMSSEKAHKHPQTGRTINYHRIEIIWEE